MKIGEFVKTTDLSCDWMDALKAYKAAGFSDAWIGFGEAIAPVEGWRIPYDESGARITSLPNAEVFSLYIAWAQNQD